MCHPGIPPIPHYNLVVARRRMVLEAVVEAETGHAREEVAGGAGDGASSIKNCLCSPTRHPGSFRCRYHHADYVWGGRITKKLIKC
ncbi:hypothetical protein Tsubulata_006028 [Turnera subulata]|uniref:Uncharacterized protein n=1 Tax=Turnera subulata TaxID=218843 RepID=A0A9Q0JLQ3_9ROSI|nr:hypothetical protein Tsubulata_006028 [Turnera subulata]